MNLSFLDDLFKGIGGGLANVDKFVDREMPFDFGWAFPAAVAGGAYFGLPALMGGLGEGAAGAGAVGGEGVLGSLGGGESFLGTEFIPNIDMMNVASSGDGSIGSGGMNSLLSSLGLDGGSMAGQEAFQLPMQSYTPDYLNALADYNGVQAENKNIFDILTGNTEQGLYNKEATAAQQTGKTLTEMLKKKQQQSALDQLSGSGSKMQEQNTAQQAEQNRMAQQQAMMRRGQGVDTTTALLSLLQDRQQLRQPRISLI